MMLPPEDILEATKRRFEETKDDQIETLRLIGEGRRSEADDPEQRKKRERYLMRDPAVREAVAATFGAEIAHGELLPRTVNERILGGDNFLGVAFLPVGVRASKTVACIHIFADGSAGTGFMVSPELMLTNHHVLPDISAAQGSFADFNFERDEKNRLLPKVVFDLDPDRFFLNDEELDFALVAVKPRSRAGNVPLSRFGFNRLSDVEGKAQQGEKVNIIQHPGGSVKRLALQDNDITKRLPNFLQYVADTRPGSSGSPVFNNQWQVVALHHSGVPDTFDSGPNQGQRRAIDGTVWDESQGEDKLKWIANEGVRISRIMRRLKEKAGGLSAAQRQMADALLKAVPNGEPAGPSPESAANSLANPTNDDPINDNPTDTHSEQGENDMNDNGVRRDATTSVTVKSADGAIQVTIPLTITVQLGTVSAAGTSDATTYATTTPDDPEGLREVLNEAERFNSRPYIPADDAQKAHDYYAALSDGLNPDALYTALSDLVTDTHRNKPGYAPSSQLYPWVDRQKDGGILSIYTNQKFSVPTLIRESFHSEEALRVRESALLERESLSAEERTQQLDEFEASLQFNCEHVVPQSWFGKMAPMRGDLHHLFACEMRCNSFRSNTPYYDFPDFEAEMKECGRSVNGKFEPKRGKAAVARAALYFLLRYPGQVNPNEMPLDRLPILLKWAKSAPPSEYERHRNAAIFAVQGNRNPLIDHPEWTEKIRFAKGIS